MKFSYNEWKLGPSGDIMFQIKSYDLQHSSGSYGIQQVRIYYSVAFHCIYCNIFIFLLSTDLASLLTLPKVNQFIIYQLLTLVVQILAILSHGLKLHKTFKC